MMVNSFTIKLILAAALVVISFTWVYVWHYVPMQELETKRSQVKTLEVEKKTESFESRHKAIKESISKKEEKPHEEVNLTIGVHTTIFD